jgi:purine-binding chemotaxis protein CheW
MEVGRRKSLNGARFLSFELGAEVYCIDILKARELITWTEVTPLPQTPASVLGVLNLRGQIIPVVDLRIKFGLEGQAPTRRTSIIVVEVERDGALLCVGVVVDAVREVISIPEGKISHLPYINAQVKAEYIRGVADTPSGMVILLDVVHSLNDDDYAILQGVNT